jgi:hypothetical protein
VALLLTLLRFGPRLDVTARDMGHSHQSIYSATGSLLPGNDQAMAKDCTDPEMQPLKRDPAVTASFRTRTALSGIL